jgi:hypothetical protein
MQQPAWSFACPDDLDRIDLPSPESSILLLVIRGESP